MNVSAVMSRDVVTTRPDVPLEDAATLLLRRGVSGLPVVDGSGEVVGVLSETDLVARTAAGDDPDGVLERLLYLDLVEERKLEAATAGDAMSMPAVTIDSADSVHDAALVMLKHDVSRLPVVHDSRLVGIITRADVVRAFASERTGVAERPFPVAGDLTGHVALVTGGVRGIGLATCERLIARGAVVAAGYSRPSAAAEQFLALHADEGASLHRGNIAVREDCERVVREVIEQHGHLEILVNNAGITADHTVRKMAAEEWDRVVQVNLSGTFYMCQAALPHMIERGYGRIVNISSVVGEIGNIGQANYAASKAGLFGLTMSLARECASKGITVNAVSPGFIQTDMVAAVPPEALARVVERIPVGRLGEPDEVARVIEFLADPGSSYITGVDYDINGGLAM